MVAVARRTDRYGLTRADGAAPDSGEYVPMWVLDNPEGAVVCCPECGERTTLDAEIAAGGEVNPAFTCPAEDCDWHEYLRLEGWPG